MRPWILLAGVGIVNTGPHHNAATFRLHGNAKLGKVSTASLLDVVQVQKDGQDSNPRKSVIVEGDVVVMFSVELPHLVFQELPIFAVIFGDARDVLDSV